MAAIAIQKPIPLLFAAWEGASPFGAGETGAWGFSTGAREDLGASSICFSASFWAHSGQKKLPSGISLPHLIQFIFFSLFQLVQIQTEAVQTVLHEPVKAGHVKVLQSLQCLLGRGLKLRISGLELLNAFDMG